jgi:flagellar L-ring protein precursor FlgH
MRERRFAYLKLASLAALALSLSVAHAQQDNQAVDSLGNDGSLFPKNGSVNLFTRRTAHRKGDILTILVNESTAAQMNATTTSAKTDANTVNPFTSPLLNWFKVPGLNTLLGGGSSGATSSTSGTGTTANNQTFTASIAVVVKDVTPEGNLLIEGTKWIKVNKESQNLTLTGIVRTDDVQPGNTVLSQNIANAKISVDGKGLIADRQRRGILTRLLEWIF